MVAIYHHLGESAAGLTMRLLSKVTEIPLITEMPLRFVQASTVLIHPIRTKVPNKKNGFDEKVGVNSWPVSKNE